MKLVLKLLLTVIVIMTLLGCNNVSEKTTPIKKQNNKIEMVTTKGTMVIELYDETPFHRDNFLNLAKNKAYDSLLFHRVINSFMIQAGDPDSKNAAQDASLGEGDAPYMVQAEFNDSLFHKKGVLAAARDNNPARSSSAMQFYIVQGKVFNDSLLLLAEERINKGKAVRDYKATAKHTSILDSLDRAMNKPDFKKYYALQDTIWNIAKADSAFVRYTIPDYQRTIYTTIGGAPHLDQNYTVFGEVVDGLAVIDSIANVATDMNDRPIQDIRLVSVRVIE